MTRDEAYQRATVAVYDRQTALHTGLDGFPRVAAGLGVQDWKDPSLHDVLAALEAIGVLKFDAPPKPPPLPESFGGVVVTPSVDVPAGEYVRIQHAGGHHLPTHVVIEALYRMGYTVTRDRR